MIIHSKPSVNVIVITCLLISMLLISWFIYTKQSSSIIYLFTGVNHSLPRINVLTRTSERPTCFSILKQSFDNQTYKNKRMLISSDTESSYLNCIDGVHKQTNVDKSTPCFYNLYLNNLWKNVTEGWIMFIDDDAKFVDSRFLSSLAKKCATLDKNTILIVNTYYGPTKDPFPRKLAHGNFDMCNICVHHTCTHRFPNRCSGDWIFLQQLLKDQRYKIEHFNNKQIGIWANYMGKANGRKVVCT
uniref:Uncharacterized protein n=1 Tax=Pyramimonas orientalis virus TaxID=455367 RepID=A0A7M3UPB5_POV01|nr:hypothetical protein HWQ62_00463 [Pyramimonas orientalis virus]